MWLELQADIVNLGSQGLNPGDITDQVKHKYCEILAALNVKLSRNTVARVLQTYHEKKGTIEQEVKPRIITFLQAPDLVDTEKELRLCISSAAAIRDWSLDSADKSDNDQLRAGWAKLSLEAMKVIGDIVAKAREQLLLKSTDDTVDQAEKQRLDELTTLALESIRAKEPK